MSRVLISTFNVHFGKNVEKIAKSIKENEHLGNTDILLLQEVEAHAKEEKERAHRIADILGMHWTYAPARPVRKENTHGLAILSKYPIVNTEVVQLEFFKLGFVSRTRIALNAEIEVGGESILVSNIHLDTRLNFEDRATQMLSILHKLNEHHIKKVVVGGDLNTLPFVWAKNTFPILYDNQHTKFYNFMKEHGLESKMEKPSYTLKRGLIKLSLDAVYVRGLKMCEFGIEQGVKVSDHKPVWAELEVT